jgi:exodeoxyribonuclease VII large subunit
MMKEFPAWEIHLLTRHIKRQLENDSLLQNIWIRGEISNYKRHSSGHVYFSLKDEFSAIRCVMFRSRSNAMDFSPKNGDKVLALGSVSVYERDGTYQFYVDEMRLAGVGDLHIAFELLKKKLEEEGLFRPEVKKPLPFLPRKVGVVTSATGAAVRDIISVMRRRFENTPVLIVPVRVQGDEAPSEIAAALDYLNSRDDVDVIIVGRGGGSFEELNAFNAEIVARSIYASLVPVVSAVGHETDFTIADFVADLRAPTPSAAAELVVPDKSELKRQLYSQEARVKYLLVRKHEISKERLIRVLSRPVMKKPQASVQQRYQDVDILMRETMNRMNGHLRLDFERFRSLTQKLQTLSPLNILSRGYALCTDINTSAPIRSLESVTIDQRVNVRLTDGEFISIVKEVRQEELRNEKKQ